MKKEWIFSIVLFLIASFLCPPQWAQAQNAKEKNITMEFKNERLPSVFKRLEKISGYKILFTYDDVNQFAVTGSIKNQTLEQALKTIIGDKPLDYYIDGKYVNITLKAQEKTSRGGVKKDYTVRGEVLDSEGLPLPGANILIKGSAKGTVTDMDGKFSLPLNDAQACVLVFSYIGMTPQEIRVTPGNNENILLNAVTLVEDQAQIAEVVVTGIFQKARESYTGAVSTVTKEELKMFKGQNLLQTLRNVDASLNIPMNNMLGSDPNAIPQMNIRGTSSLPMNVKELNETTQQSVNMPLVIMDGFEITLTKLMDYNDEEIESITILKDASATAIYGSRGANGIIVVQSKKPVPGKLRVTAQLGLNVEVPDLSSYKLLNAADKLELERTTKLYEAKGDPTQTVSYQERYNKRLKDVLSGVDTDWLSQPLQNGVGQRYNVRLEGGSDEFRWGTSVGYKNTEGAMKGSSRKVFNGDITLMYSLKNLIFRNNTSITNSRSENSKYGSFSTYVSQQPYNRLYDEEGRLIRYFDGFYPSNVQVQNPLYDATLNTFDKSRILSLINNFAIDWRIISDLNLKAQFGYSTERLTSDNFYPAEHSMFSNTNKYPIGSTNKGSYTYGNGESISYDGSLTLSYSKTFNDLHQVYAGLNYSVSESQDETYSFRAEGFSNGDLSFIGNALQYAADESPEGKKTISRRVGVTGNVNYSYNNRYFADFSYRMDGSSQFGSNKRYAPFWSFGIGWNLHHEKFMEKLPFISQLKLRASLGETGTMDFSKSDVLSMYTYVSGEQYAYWNSAHLQGLGNENLTWQTTSQTNLGIDFQFFDGRIFGSFDWYNKETDGLVSYMSLPLSMGFSSYSENVGKVKNSGFEMSLGAYIIRDEKRNLSWMINGQLVHNKNRITKLSDAIMSQNKEVMSSAELKDTEPATLLYEGRPQYGIYVVRSLGIDPATGEEIYLDRNGNVTSVWNSEDRVYCGENSIYSSPYKGKASTMFRWKNLSLNVSFEYQWGGQIYNQTLIDRVEVTKGRIRSSNVDKRVFTDRWQNPGDISFYRKIDENETKATSRFVMDDNLFEIQSIGLEYRWNTDWLRKATHLQSVLFGVNMSNLWHFSSIRCERGTSYPFARNIQGTVTLLF